MNNTDDIIIKALKKGVPIRRISKETGVPERTLWGRIEKNKEYKMAYEHYKTFVDNLFS